MPSANLGHALRSQADVRMISAALQERPGIWPLNVYQRDMSPCSTGNNRPNMSTLDTKPASDIADRFAGHPMADIDDICGC